MKKRNLVAESIDDFYGKGYTSDSTLPKGNDKFSKPSKDYQDTIVDDIINDVVDYEEVLDAKSEKDLFDLIHKYMADYTVATLRQ